jgi:tripartite-type tricarboxylate transporter receptor subunit TctC
MFKLLITCVFSMLTATTVLAWQPTKPVEVLIGFSPGSGNELVFRALAAEVEKNTGAKFVVVTRPGAGGAIASKQLTQAAADGHTVAMVIGEGIPVQDKISVPDPAVRGYTVNDFTYLLAPALNQYVVFANAEDPINSTQDLIRALNSEPLTFGASGGSRLVYEVLKQKTTFKDVAHIQHNGPVPAVTDVAGGHVRLAVVPSLVANRFIDSGRIKFVALSGANRLPQMPDVPTLSEQVPGLNVITTWGLVAPKGLPPEITAWYVREFTKALYSESVQTFWKNNLIEIPNAKLLTSAGFEAYVRQTEKDFEPTVTLVQQQMAKK